MAINCLWQISANDGLSPPKYCISPYLQTTSKSPFSDFAGVKAFRTTASATLLSEQCTSMESLLSLFIHILPWCPAPSASHGWAVTQQQETWCWSFSVHIQGIAASCFLTVIGARQNPSEKVPAAFILHRRLPLLNSLPCEALHGPISPSLLPSFHSGNRFWRNRGTTANSDEFLPNPAKKSKHSREAQRFIQRTPWFLLAAKDFARPYFACVWRHRSVWSQRLVKKKELSLFSPAFKSQ